MDRPDPRAARAQASTAGGALLAVGAAGVGLGAACWALGLHPPYLDPESLLATAAVVLVVGAALRWTRH